VKARKRENAKTCKAGKPFLQKAKTTLQTIELALIKMGETRKNENAKTAKSVLVFWFSRFPVFWFSRSGGRIFLARSRFLCA